ncbi:MAG: helix-turn-helix domain-containing protein, partial [Candidatus Promineifilaceae bacterium]
DMREVAGLTLMELSEALDLEDKTLLEAVENGTATLSFELILRLAALVARHDPLPFVMRMTRTYNPGVWRILEDWGVGRMTLQFEREREFVNILRPHDGARKLSDDGFAKVLEVTKSAFELALFYALAEEGIQDRIGPTGEASPTGDD